MMQKRLLLVIVGMVAAGGYQPLNACVCAREVYPRDAFAQADAVFVGTVTGIEHTPHRTNKDGIEFVSSMDPVLVRMEVQRAWKGVSVGGGLTVQTVWSSASCGFDFRRGETYLIYASSRGGVLRTSKCQRTRTLREAAPEIDYLDRLEAGEAAGFLFGRPFFRWTKQLEGHRVIARDALGQEFETTTDGKGWFVIRDLSPGTYQILVPIDPVLNPDPAVREVTLRDETDAVEVRELHSYAAARLSGRILALTGVPVPGFSLQLRYQDGMSLSTRSDSEGRYVLRHVYPGNAELVALFDTPESREAIRIPGGTPAEEGRPEGFDIEQGQILEMGDMTLPFQLEPCTIRGRVVGQEGHAVGGARVFADHHDSSLSAVSDSQGFFSLLAYSHQAYELRALEYTADGQLKSFGEVHSGLCFDFPDPLVIVLKVRER